MARKLLVEISILQEYHHHHFYHVIKNAFNTEMVVTAFKLIGNQTNKEYICIYILRGWGSLTMTSTGKFVYMAHNFILLRLNLFGLRVDREGWWFEHSM